MRFLRRSLVGLFLMSLTLAVLALAGQTLWSSIQARLSDEPPARRAAERVYAVNVVTVEPQEITPVLSVFGEIRSRRTLEIRATAPGRVVWLADAFEEGGEVTEGETLVRIDPADAASALRVAESDMDEAEAELAQATKAIELARDDLAAAESQAALREQALARQKDAKNRGIATDTSVEDAELVAASSRQAVLSKRSALAQAEAREALARTRLSRQEIIVAEAERALADTEIKAPFSGTLSGVTLVTGRLVANNENLAQLIDPNALEVVFRLSASEYARLLDAQGRLIPARVQVGLDVAGIDLTAEGAIERESAEVGTGQTGRQIFARLDRPRGLRPGDFVSVRIRELPLENVALLPSTAVGADQTVLVVGDGDRLERVTVETLRRQGDSVIVRAGALAGRDVVEEQTPLLGAGIRVRPIHPGAEAAAGDATAPARPGPEAAGAETEMVELTDERRARLVAYVEGNTRLPAEAKQRVLAQLQGDRVPADVVARLEQRMGG
ncbi:efflux RND transporter periplasmic adaptor subunit [Frigidibacter sp. ROC022]|uniref:efflux RND transporter periplasmic adaptor subunit n=1 Tax=Frigidibacter sp. ROC022 TaxID=2971796 RepID=UPI00215A1E4E|nr:efflux RND transporter periplasmic adaptor subunit [Frigidibacter sp. ROC022]MCR8726601.1 efflux RND transporter periplasmic adaptor subunit [Frigidibacter sp. ROC022]